METAALIAEKFSLDLRKVDFFKEINFCTLRGMAEELGNELSRQVLRHVPSRA